MNGDHDKDGSSTSGTDSDSSDTDSLDSDRSYSVLFEAGLKPGTTTGLGKAKGKPFLHNGKLCQLYSYDPRRIQKAKKSGTGAPRPCGSENCPPGPAADNGHKEPNQSTTSMPSKGATICKGSTGSAIPGTSKNNNPQEATTATLPSPSEGDNWIVVDSDDDEVQMIGIKWMTPVTATNSTYLRNRTPVLNTTRARLVRISVVSENRQTPSSPRQEKDLSYKSADVVGPPGSELVGALNSNGAPSNGSIATKPRTEENSKKRHHKVPVPHGSDRLRQGSGKRQRLD